MSEIAKKKFPYDTEKECKDEFTRNLRNGIIDLLRQTFDLGMEYKEKEMMKGAVEGQVERGYCEDGISEHFEVFAYLSGRDERFKDLSDGQSVKVIIIKE